MKKITRNKPLFIMYIILILLMFGSSGFLFYETSLLNNIENKIRLIIRIVLCIVDIVFIWLVIKNLKRIKKLKTFLLIIFMLIYSGACAFIGYNISKVYSSLKQVSSNAEYTVYSSSLVTLKDSKAEGLKDIGQEIIGILDDKNSYESNIIPLEMIEKQKITNETKTYVSAISMIDDLLEGKIKYIFLPTNYSIIYGSTEGYENLKEKTKIITTKTKKVKKDNSKTKKSNKPITEPFTVLLMGVDSETEGIEGSSFNGDSLMVITFNPKTLSATMLSIPRDSYVPISCFANKRKNKITHAAWHGESCMIDTIEQFLSVDIDYYAKINFKGVVNLIDTLNGVKIDVPYSMCEQNSNREWGSNTVYIKQGLQTLNGEQALAYSRNRHPNPGMCSKEWTNYTSNDFIRGQHQQEVVTALLDRFKSISSLDTVYKLLDTISNNMMTNMSTNQILSLYNILKDMAAKSNGKNASQMFDIQRLYINGYDQRIVDYGGSGLELYNYVPHEASVKAVSRAMKINLNLIKEDLIKTFSFNINNPYEEEIIGKKETSKSKLVLLPNFVGQDLASAQTFCSTNGIKVNVTYVTTGGVNGSIVSQSVSAKANVEDVSSITLNVVQTNNIVKELDKEKNEEKDAAEVVPNLPSADDSEKEESENGLEEQNDS